MNDLERLLHQGKRRLNTMMTSFSQKKEEPGRPNIKICPVCGRFVEASSRTCEYCDAQLQAKPQPSLASGNDNTENQTLNPVVILFGIFVLFQFIAILSSSKIKGHEFGLLFSPNGDVLLQLGANWNAATILHGELWRTCTYMFLHGDFMHLFFNVSCLAQLGPVTFMNFGARRFWLISLVTGMGGGLLSALSVLLNIPAFSVGFSGALFGYLGVNYIFFSRSGHFMIAQRLKNYMIYGNLICIALTLTGIMRIDNLAHIGGMLTGLGLGLLFNSRHYNYLSPVWEKAALAFCFSIWGYGLFRIIQNVIGG